MKEIQIEEMQAEKTAKSVSGVDGRPVVFKDRIEELAGEIVSTAPKTKPVAFDSLVQIIKDQRVWSEETFGPGERTEGLVDHICKELAEILASGGDLVEWMDVVILALDGAWRCGYSPEDIVASLLGKQTENRSRKWPDWRTAEPGKAIEHVREECCGDCDGCDRHGEVKR